MGNNEGDAPLAVPHNNRLGEIAAGLKTLQNSLGRDLISLGRLLNEARSLLPSDIAFGQWRSANMTLNEKTSYRAMEMARMVDGCSGTVSDQKMGLSSSDTVSEQQRGEFEADALNYLVRDGTKEDRDAAIASAKSGVVVSLEDAKKLIADRKAGAETESLAANDQPPLATVKNVTPKSGATPPKKPAAAAPVLAATTNPKSLVARAHKLANALGKESVVIDGENDFDFVFDNEHFPSLACLRRIAKEARATATRCLEAEHPSAGNQLAARCERLADDLEDLALVREQAGMLGISAHLPAKDGDEQIDDEVESAKWDAEHAVCPVCTSGWILNKNIALSVAEGLRDHQGGSFLADVIREGVECLRYSDQSVLDGLIAELQLIPKAASKATAANPKPKAKATKPKATANSDAFDLQPIVDAMLAKIKDVPRPSKNDLIDVARGVLQARGAKNAADCAPLIVDTHYADKGIGGRKGRKPNKGDVLEVALLAAGVDLTQ